MDPPGNRIPLPSFFPSSCGGSDSSESTGNDTNNVDPNLDGQSSKEIDRVRNEERAVGHVLLPTDGSIEERRETGFDTGYLSQEQFESDSGHLKTELPSPPRHKLLDEEKQRVIYPHAKQVRRQGAGQEFGLSINQKPPPSAPDQPLVTASSTHYSPSAGHNKAKREKLQMRAVAANGSGVLQQAKRLVSYPRNQDHVASDAVGTAQVHQADFSIRSSRRKNTGPSSNHDSRILQQAKRLVHYPRQQRHTEQETEGLGNHGSIIERSRGHVGQGNARHAVSQTTSNRGQQKLAKLHARTRIEAENAETHAEEEVDSIVDVCSGMRNTRQLQGMEETTDVEGEEAASREEDRPRMRNERSLQGMEENQETDESTGFAPSITTHDVSAPSLENRVPESPQTRRSIPTEDLVVAHRISEDAMNLPVAEALDEFQRGRKAALEERRMQRLRQGMCCLGIIATLVLLLSTSLSLVYTNSNDRPTIGPSSAPTASPTQSPTLSTEGYVKSLLRDPTRKTIEEEPTSPQSLAFQFVLKDPLLSNYSEWRIKQRFALAAFYHGANGANWRFNDGWLSYDIHECQWYATEPVLHTQLGGLFDGYDSVSNASNPCEENDLEHIERGQYRHLWLSGNALNGTLVPQLFGMLTSLKTVLLEAGGLIANCDTPELGCNAALAGELPTEIGLMTDLQHVSLILHDLSGQLPSQLGQVSTLTQLRLVSNNFNSTIPAVIGHAANLQWLDLQRCMLQGTIPSEIGKLSRLQRLGLSQNSLTGSIPSEVGHLTELVYLYASFNELNGTIPSELGRCAALSELILGFNDLTGTIPSEVGQLDMREFFLDANNIENCPPASCLI